MIYTKNEILNWCFWDIETKPAYDSFHSMPEHMQEIWLEKYHIKYVEKYIERKQKEAFLKDAIEGNFKYQKHTDVIIEEKPTVDFIYLDSASLQAEFAKIMCISMGLFIEENGRIGREIITFNDENEVDILNNFKTFLNSPEAQQFKLAGYNIREFDIPFTTKRFLINRINLPYSFELRGKKPWEINIADICEDWKGLQREIIGLDLLCTVLGIDTPKDKFKNSEVVGLFLSGKITLKDVGEYCEKDVKAVMDVVEFVLTK